MGEEWVWKMVGSYSWDGSAGSELEGLGSKLVEALGEARCLGRIAYIAAGTVPAGDGGRRSRQGANGPVSLVLMRRKHGFDGGRQRPGCWTAAAWNLEEVRVHGRGLAAGAAGDAVHGEIAAHERREAGVVAADRRGRVGDGRRVDDREAAGDAVERVGQGRWEWDRLDRSRGAGHNWVEDGRPSLILSGAIIIDMVSVGRTRHQRYYWIP